MKNLYILLLFSNSFGQNYSLQFNQGEYARIPVITEIQNADEVTIEIWYYEEMGGGEENIIGNEWFGGTFELYRDSDGTIDFVATVDSGNCFSFHYCIALNTTVQIDTFQCMYSNVTEDYAC